MQYKILFKRGQPITSKKISKALNEFGASYTANIRKIIETTNGDMFDKELFIQNAAKILNNFKMTRQGAFKGLGFGSNGQLIGPVEKLHAAWDSIGDELLELKALLHKWGIAPRARTVVLLSDPQLKIVTDIVWSAFKKLLPITMGKYSYGLVGASKILFAAFPEVVVPVDNAEWLQLFKTVDLGDVIKMMAQEIREWENITGCLLENCEKKYVPVTLPAIYNVMAMRARP